MTELSNYDKVGHYVIWEKNKVNIKDSTLLKLAAYYGFDIICEHHKLIDDSMIQILELINQDIQGRNIDNIKNSLGIINEINNCSTSMMISCICKQYYHLISGLISLHHNDYLSARKSFLNGIKSVDSFIDINNFNNIGSSNMQLRLLMAYAITFKSGRDYDKCLDLLGKVSSNLSHHSNLMRKKVTYNIANLYSLIGEYNKSNDILDNYLSSYTCNNISYDNIIYFKKATVSYLMGVDDYRKYAFRCLYASILSKDINNGLIFLNVFNKLFDEPMMTEEEFLSI